MSARHAVTVPTARQPARWIKLASLVFQLSLVLLVIQQYNVESQTFFRIAVLTVVGFAVHASLPHRLRLPFFVLLSFTGIAVAFGLRDGAWLVAVGAGLIGICHLPIRTAARVVLLLAVGTALAFSRAGVLPAPWSSAVWPILASMFMFRLAVYIYALQHDNTPRSLSRTLAYFFMLPNVCFPLFPVVDYGAFRRTYYDREEFEIYGRGVQWIVRGLLHLLVYRFVYLNLTLEPAALGNLGDVVQFILATFLLYLRVSGQFHLVVGMLYLFGFRLPETHRLYYLASSFTDLWRRINIYWKDFLLALVYYPTFFRLRRWAGERAALIAATIIVFLSTWLLHSYQWFWLRGGFPITAQDGIFWGLLGALVVASSLREIRRGRQRTLGKPQRWSIGRGLRTALMFWGMALLWSLWSSESVGEWFAMWLVATRVDSLGILLLAGTTLILVAAGGRNWDAVPNRPTAQTFYRRPALQGSALLLAILFFGHPAVYQHVGKPRLVAAVASLHSQTLNARDAAVEHKGYYENLDRVGRLDAQLWSTSSKTRPADWVVLEASQLYRKRSDFLGGELRPSMQHTLNGQVVTTNRWGMRDREYSLAKPPNTYRIAVLGPSFVMGLGVGDEETFEAVLEKRLNAEAAFGVRYEVLNFGVGNYSLLHQMAMLTDRVWDFELDAVVITMTSRSFVVNSIVNHLVRVGTSKIAIPDQDIRELLQKAGVEQGQSTKAVLAGKRLVWLVARKFGASREMLELDAERQIRSLADEIAARALQRVGREAQQHGVVPILLGLDIVSTSGGKEVTGQRAAEDAGFVVINLFDVYDGKNLSELRAAEWDSHPNPRGHRLIADRLYSELTRRAGELRLQPNAGRAVAHATR